MSHFYVESKGQAPNTATRQGSKLSGISTQIQSPNLGVFIKGSLDDEFNDVFEIYVNLGRENPTSNTLIGKVKLSPQHFPIIELATYLKS